MHPISTNEQSLRPCGFGFKSVNIFVLALSLLVFNATSADAQEKPIPEPNRIAWDAPLQDWFVDLHLGMTMPYTDVRTYDWGRTFQPISEYQYGVGASLTKMVNNVFGVQARYTFGRVVGVARFNNEDAEIRQFWNHVNRKIFNYLDYESDRPEPFFSSTFVHQPSINMYVNISNMFMGTNRSIRAKMNEKEMRDRIFSLYARAGVGITFYDANLYRTSGIKDGEEIEPKDKTEITKSRYLAGTSGKSSDVVFPLGLGMKFKVSQKIDIGLEAEMNFVHTDKLDALQVDDLGRNNGNTHFVSQSPGGRNDKYAFVNVSVGYKFGNLKAQKEHLQWVTPMEAYADANDAKVQFLLDNMYYVKDADGDGVIDELDEDPNTPEGATVDTKGNVLDSDKDGIADYEDPEPYSSPELPIVDGKNVYPEPEITPEMAKEIDGMIHTVLKTSNTAGWQLSMIFFDSNSDKVKANEIPELYRVATIMKKFPEMNVNVKGHTDVLYTDDYNMSLSEKRTNSVIDFLVETYGISRDRFVPGFFGEKDNLFPNAKSSSQHLLNRRVELSPVN